MTYTREEILEHRAEWLAELRSGRHMQGRGFLMDEHLRKCCLGVAEVTRGTKTAPDRARGNHYIFVSENEPEDRSTSFLTNVTAQWLGLNTSSPDLSNGVSLISMNDDRYEPFENIADAIEDYGFNSEHELPVMREA